MLLKSYKLINCLIFFMPIVSVSLKASVLTQEIKINLSIEVNKELLRVIQT